MDIKAKKSLGQNFLKDENILKKIADSFSTTCDDVIIEIGPGQGALTKHLVEKNGHLICYEIDTRMESLLLHFESEDTSIIFDDFLKRDITQDIPLEHGSIYVIANIPYYITTPIIEHVLASGLDIAGMTLLVQKEVAERFCAVPGTKTYGYFTVYLKHFFESESLFSVSPSCFTPAPKVMSEVVKLVKKENRESIDINEFQVFLKDCFQNKRKTLRNNLKGYDWHKIESVLRTFANPNTVRAEELSYEEFVTIFKSLA